MARQVQPSEGGNSRDTVLVACNIPNGLEMRCWLPNKVQQPVLGGGVKEVVEYNASDPDFPPLKLNGPAVPWGQRPGYDIKAGYALTVVPKRYWERWSSQNPSFIKSRSVFAADDRDSAVGQAKDYRDVRSGLQPLRRKKDPRVKLKTRKEIVVSEDDGSEIPAD